MRKFPSWYFNPKLILFFFSRKPRSKTSKSTRIVYWWFNLIDKMNRQGKSHPCQKLSNFYRYFWCLFSSIVCSRRVEITTAILMISSTKNELKGTKKYALDLGLTYQDETRKFPPDFVTGKQDWSHNKEMMLLLKISDTIETTWQFTEECSEETDQFTVWLG